MNLKYVTKYDEENLNAFIIREDNEARSELSTQHTL